MNFLKFPIAANGLMFAKIGINVMQVFYNFIAIFIRVAANSLSNVFQKKLAFEGENPINVNFINYLLLSLFSIPLLFFVDFTGINLTFLLYALAGGLTGAVCNCFMVMALEKGELSVLGPINSYKAVIGLIFGMLILHEIPNMYGIMGILLIISGSYFILESPGALMKKDIQYRIYALIFSAIEAVFIKKVIILSSITASFITSSFLGAIFSFIIMNIFIKCIVTCSFIFFTICFY